MMSPESEGPQNHRRPFVKLKFLFTIFTVATVKYILSQGGPFQMFCHRLWGSICPSSSFTKNQTSKQHGTRGESSALNDGQTSDPSSYLYRHTEYILCSTKRFGQNKRHPQSAAAAPVFTAEATQNAFHLNQPQNFQCEASFRLFRSQQTFSEEKRFAAFHTADE